jgi:glutathione S-transferase
MSPRPVRLYDFPFSGNGYKVRLALAQLGMAVDYRVVDILKGEAKTPEFLAMNPVGQIPVLELSDGTFLRESNAILCWLADGTPLAPDDRLSRARLVQWMCFEQSHIDQVIGRAKFLRAFPHFRQTTQAEFEGWWATARMALSVIDGELSDKAFILGQRYTIGDICLYGYVHVAPEAGLDLAPYPRVRAWLDRVRAQPGHIGIDDV